MKYKVGVTFCNYSISYTKKSKVSVIKHDQHIKFVKYKCYI